VQCPHCDLFGHVNKKDCKYKHCINVEVDWLNILLSVSASHTITELFKASECTVDPNSLRCNHVPTQPPHIDGQKQIGHKCPGSQGQPTAATRLSQWLPRLIHLISPGPTQCASLCETPGVNNPGHRRLHASLADRPQHPPVRVNRHRTACEKLSQLNFKSLKVRSDRFNFETWKSQQHLGGADYTRTAAVRCCVYASLAPAEPPPPAGLASGLTCWFDLIWFELIFRNTNKQKAIF
jgi:hypothetical protein